MGGEREQEGGTFRNHKGASVQAVPPPNTGTSFRRVRRGYDPVQVDDFLGEIELAMRALEQRAKVATTRAGALERRMAGANAASSGVGRAMVEAAERKEAILREAEERAAVIVAEAQARAAAVDAEAGERSEGTERRADAGDAAAEAEQIVSAARAAAAETADAAARHRDQAWLEVEQTLDSARTEAARILLAARRDALELLAETRREAQRLIARAQAGDDGDAVVARLPVRSREPVAALHAGSRGPEVRFDVVEATDGEIHHIVVLD